MDKQDCHDSNKCCLNLVLCITCLTRTDNQIQHFTFKRICHIPQRLSWRTTEAYFMLSPVEMNLVSKKFMLICNVFKFRNKSIVRY